MSFKDLELGGGDNKFFRLMDGENRLRIVSDFVPVWTSFNRADSTAKKYLTVEGASLDKEAKKRFAMWVIDRVDNKVKLAEFGVSIMKGIKALALSSETEFSELPPYDIIITRSGSGMETEYVVAASRKETTLTAEEVKEITGLAKVISILLEDAEDKGQVIPF